MIYNTVHSSEFISCWKKVLYEVYKYDTYIDYLIVPSLIMSKTLSYLPLLNYSDRLSNNVSDLLELSKDNRYQIRTLNSEYKNFKPYDTVTMRLDISCYNSEQVFNKIIKSKCRNQIRKSQKCNLEIKRGGNELLNDFYELFFNTMHTYGTPAFSKILFESILNNIESQLFVIYLESKPISGLLLILDNDICLVPWAASDSNYNKYCPNHLMYFNAIEYAIEKRCGIFDFGRSGYETSATYNFKKQWGAQPVKIDLLSSEKSDIYNKYTLASNIWKKLPKCFTRFLGPKLCKYLGDL